MGADNQTQLIEPPLTLDPPADIFRAYDIRGIAGQQIDAELAEAIGHAIAEKAKAAGEQAIAVGADCRLSSPEIAKSLIKGILMAGLNVIDLGEVPSPLTYFATHTLAETSSSIAVTASHNPSEYTGFKTVLKGEPLKEEAIQSLYQWIVQEWPRPDTQTPIGKAVARDIKDAYIADVLQHLRLNTERPIRLVVDAGNSVCGLIAPRLYEALGCEVIPLFCEPDGHFPNHHPDPAKAENTQELQRQVIAHRADMGLAFDGDGDRIGLIDEKGERIEPDRMMMLFVKEILNRRPGESIIFDVKCTASLREYIEDQGGTALVSPSGHSLIKTLMQQTGACLAGEMSGHIFFQDRWYGFDDALYTGARLLELLSHIPATLSSLMEEFPCKHASTELEISVSEPDKFALAAQITSNLRIDGGEPSYIDGVKIEFSDGWGLIRPSNTSAKLTARFEGDTPEALARIHQAFRTQLAALDQRLILPPLSRS